MAAIAVLSIRIADFILPRIRSLAAAKPSHFYQGLAKRFAVLSRPASRSGRFILSKAMAVLSRPACLNSSFNNSGRFIKARPVAAMAGLSPRSGRVARSLDLDCGGRFHIAPHKQFINGQVEPFLERAGKASG